MRRVLIISMGVMGIGLASVMFAIAWKLNTPDQSPFDGAPATLNLSEIDPRDVVSASLDGEQVLLVVRQRQGALDSGDDEAEEFGLTLFVINVATGDVLKSLKLE